MEEKTTRAVMMKYFEAKGMKPIPQKGAGPDILIEGMAVEVKGSRHKVKRMLRQVLSYAFKYSEVALALPVDSLTYDELMQLEMLCRALMGAGKRNFEIYIVVDSTKSTTTFYVYKIPHSAYPCTFTYLLIPEQVVFEEDDSLETAQEKFRPLINWKPTEALVKRFQKPLYWATTIEI